MRKNRKVNTIQLLGLVFHETVLENAALPSCHLPLLFCPVTVNSFFKSYKWPLCSGPSAAKALIFLCLLPTPRSLAGDVVLISPLQVVPG